MLSSTMSASDTLSRYLTRARRLLPCAAMMIRLPERTVSAAPDLDLRIAELRCRFGLVEPLQRAVMALVEAPGFLRRDPHPVHVLEHDPQRLDGALEHGGKRKIEVIALAAQEVSGSLGLLDALFAQADVGPAGEPVLLVPDRFPVAQQNKFFHGRAIRS